jgi:hypothetical protein
LVCFVRFTTVKKVVGVFVRFRASLQSAKHLFSSLHGAVSYLQQSTANRASHVIPPQFPAEKNHRCTGTSTSSTRTSIATRHITAVSIIAATRIGVAHGFRNGTSRTSTYCSSLHCRSKGKIVVALIQPFLLEIRERESGPWRVSAANELLGVISSLGRVAVDGQRLLRRSARGKQP